MEDLENKKGKQISKDLFEDYVDDGRKIGYNDRTIDFGDTFELKSYDSSHLLEGVATGRMLGASEFYIIEKII